MKNQERGDLNGLGRKSENPSCGSRSHDKIQSNKLGLYPFGGFEEMHASDSLQGGKEEEPDLVDYLYKKVYLPGR